MKIRKFWAWLLVVLIAAGLAASLWLASARWQAEQAVRDTAIYMDNAQLQELANSQGISYAELLSQLSDDVDGILFKELLLAEESSVTMQSGSELSTALLLAGQDNTAIRTDCTYIFGADDEVFARVFANISSKVPAENYCEIETLLLGGVEVPVIVTDYAVASLNTLGIGFDADQMAEAAAAGYAVIPQIRWWQTVTEESLSATFDPLAGYPVTGVAFNDASLPGSKESTEKWVKSRDLLAEKLTAMGLPLISIEFSKQTGIPGLAQQMDNNVLRLHTIALNEANKYTAESATDRFVLAASERGMRILLVRVISASDLQENLDYLSGIRQALAREGLRLGGTQAPLGDLPANPIALLLIALAVAAGGVFLCEKLRIPRLGVILAALAVLCLAGLIFSGHANMARKVMAFGAAVIYPTLALALFVPGERQSWGMAVGRLLLTSLFSLIGAALIVGALSDRIYMLYLDQFMGVKLAHVLPLLLILYLFLAQGRSPRNMLEETKKFSRQPLSYGIFIVLCIVGAMLAVYVLRTGNDSMTVSSLEQLARSWLNTVLDVRPRTKEFLVGYPLLLLVYYFGYQKKWLPVLFVGSIGQVSLVNTYAHIHTPLAVSLLRSLNGFWLGIILGTLLLLIVLLVRALLLKNGLLGTEEKETEQTHG